MEELFRDPVLAPPVGKLLHDRLQETRKALETAQKVRPMYMHCYSLQLNADP